MEKEIVNWKSFCRNFFFIKQKNCIFPAKNKQTEFWREVDLRIWARMCWKTQHRFRNFLTGDSNFWNLTLANVNR